MSNEYVRQQGSIFVQKMETIRELLTTIPASDMAREVVPNLVAMQEAFNNVVSFLERDLVALTDALAAQENRAARLQDLVDKVRTLALHFPWEAIHEVHEQTHPEGIDNVFELAAHLQLTPQETRNDIEYHVAGRLTFEHGDLVVVLPRGASEVQVNDAACERMFELIDSGSLSVRFDGSPTTKPTTPREGSW